MPFILLVINLCIVIYLIMLFARLVKAIEHIAAKTDKTSCMLEKMVDKLESAPSNLPPAD